MESGFVVSNWLAAFIAALLLAVIVAKIGKAFPKWYHLDDIIIGIIAIVFVTGTLAMTPVFHRLAHWLETVFSTGLGATRMGSVGITLVTVAILLAALLFYLAKPSLSRLAVLVIVYLPVFNIPFMRDIAYWWVNDVGSWLFGASAQLVSRIVGF